MVVSKVLLAPEPFQIFSKLLGIELVLFTAVGMDMINYDNERKELRPKTNRHVVQHEALHAALSAQRKHLLHLTYKYA